MVLPKDDSMREPRCTDEHHRALKHAERKARTYRKAVLGLAGLLLLSLSGNLASTALRASRKERARRCSKLARQNLAAQRYSSKVAKLLRHQCESSPATAAPG